jgi:hypothetical protein
MQRPNFFGWTGLRILSGPGNNEQKVYEEENVSMLGSTVSLSGRLNHRAGLGGSLQQVRFLFLLFGVYVFT